MSSSYYRTDDELRSINWRNERDGYDDGYEDDYGDYGAGAGGADGSPPRRKRRRSRTKTTLLILLSLILILIGGTVLGGYLFVEKKLGQVDSVGNPMEKLDEKTRPEKGVGAAAGAVNILLAGTDARTGGQQTTGQGNGDEWQQGGRRTDTIMILHITGDRESAHLISIPRDTYVEIPGHGMNKINAAYSYGGPELYIQTIEQFTDLRIDHLAVIDWMGFEALTDAVGGVRMNFPEEVPLASTDATLGPGWETLSGLDALGYVRMRYELPNGDFDRVRRQQNFLRALMQQTLERGTSPGKISGVIDAVTQNLSVDDSFTSRRMFELALQLRNIRGDDVEFLTIPTAGTGMEGSQSVVYADEEADKELFKAIKDDKISAWMKKTSGEQQDESVLDNNVD